jgi:hypothetical protein
MNKKIIAAFIIMSLIAPAKAAGSNIKNNTITPTVAILDTAIDTSLPVFRGRISHEVCILEWNSCPNKRSFMEGPGSSVLPLSIISKNGFDHGTRMASIFAENTSFNIVFVRIVGNTFDGQRQLVNEITIVNALDWVIKNKERLNIQAVSMSQGSYDILGPAGGEYCPKTTSTQNKVKELMAMNVPTLMSAGNNRDYNRINWPACITEVVSVGASTTQDEFAQMYSNYDSKRLDFVSLGQTTAFSPGGTRSNVTGTSVSTIIAAAQWMELLKSNPTASYDQVYESFFKTSKDAKSSRGFSARLINLNSAITYSLSIQSQKLAAQKAALIASLMAKQDTEINKVINDYNLAVLALTKTKDASIEAIKKSIQEEVAKLG